MDYGFNSNNLSVSEETIGKVIAGISGVVITTGIIVSISNIFIIGKKLYVVNNNVKEIKDKSKDK